jgi:hypothetical protein
MSDTRNTYNFDRTTDVLSTIRSQPENVDSDMNHTLSATQDDFSASQALRQYQMTLTQKDRAEDDEDSQDAASSSALGRTLSADGKGSTLQNGDVENGDAAPLKTEEAAETPRPAARARRQLHRQDASIVGQDANDSAPPATAADTKGKEEEEVVEEEVEEEEYESDYDADEDGSHPLSDDDF